MMKHQMGGEWVCLGMLLLVATVNGDSSTDKCSQQLQKVNPCLSFATGSAAIPTKDCCDAVTAMKENQPECLCYIIQQVHNGSPLGKSMGIQEAKLLRLPSACNMKNASVTNCPKLLGLSPSSPDAAIFTNASSSTPSVSSESSTTPSQAQNGSFGFPLRPRGLGDLTAIASAVLLVAFPAGFALNSI